MLSYLGKSAQLAPTLKGSAQAVANGLKNAAPTVVHIPQEVRDRPQLVLTVDSMATRCPTGQTTVKSGLGASTQVRCVHTDIKVPDFGAYRRSDVQDPQVKAKDSVAARSAFTYLLAGGGTVTGMYAAKTVVSEFISSMSASADVLALAKIEIKMDDIPEGKSVTFKWRGKPLFVRHRTDEEIDVEGQVDVASLRDPESDEVRCPEPKWLVVLGVCTHLGCVPIADAGDYGGYYCPCHGSHYDTAGRIRKGPAPLNLEIPAYAFPEEGLLVVG